MFDNDDVSRLFDDSGLSGLRSIAAREAVCKQAATEAEAAATEEEELSCLLGGQRGEISHRTTTALVLG